MNAAQAQIHYHTDFFPNPEFKGGTSDLYSPELSALIQRRNTPDTTTVYVDGSQSLTRETDTAYGFRSPCFRLKTAGQATYVYGKIYRFFNFHLNHPELNPVGGPPPQFSLLKETKTILGYPCRKAEYLGKRRQHLWFTEKAAVHDPTGAVLSLKGVPGLILQTEDMPDPGAAETLRRVTVTHLSLEKPDKRMFNIPSGYRRFNHIDEVRAEDRRLLDDTIFRDISENPLTGHESERFTGCWLFETINDAIQVDIIPAGELRFIFRSTVLTADMDAPGRVREEQAVLKGRLLCVEDPPNYRLYSTTAKGIRLVPKDNDDFTFYRMA